MEKADIAVVILAAGAGRRFAGIKQIADYCGKPLLQHALDHCLLLPETIPVYLVLGAYQQRILKRVQTGRATVLFNNQWRQGMSSSIRLAVSELSERAQRILFLAGDQPSVTTDDLQSLVALSLKNPLCNVAATYAGKIGIPAVFRADCFPLLRDLQGDRGASSVLTQLSRDLLTVDVPSAEFDVDYVDDVNK